jgi:hypothetical protein
MVMLAYEDYMRSGSTELAASDYDYQHLVLNTMISFIDPETQLVDWTSSFHWNERSWPQVCHSDPAGAISDGMNYSCDNIDWPPQKGNPGDMDSPTNTYRDDFAYTNQNVAVNSFTVRTLRMLAVLADATSRHADAARFRQQANRTANAINTLMFDESSGLYCDGLCKHSAAATQPWKDNHTEMCHVALMKSCGASGGDQCVACATRLGQAWSDKAKCTVGTIAMLCSGQNRSNHHSIHSAHYPLWLGVVPPHRAQPIVDYLAKRNKDFLVGSVYTTFMLLHGLYEHGGDDHGVAALHMMTQCSNASWCNMIKLNATTTWETWSPTDGTHSHPWSGAPASAISSGLLGVRPLSPTHERCENRLFLSNLYLKTIILPIQARDKHRESPQKRRRFSYVGS